MTTLRATRLKGEYVVLRNTNGAEVRMRIHRTTRSGSIILQFERRKVGLPSPARPEHSGRYAVHLSSEVWEQPVGGWPVRLCMRINEEDHHRIEVDFYDLPPWISVLKERTQVVEGGMESFV